MGGIAAVLLLWMLLLLFRGPRFTTDNYGAEQQTHVECGSVIAVGWPSDGSFLMDDNGGGFYGDHVASGPSSLTAQQRAGIARDCSERRDTYLGIMVLLAVPTSVLGAAAILGRPAAARRDPAGQAGRPA